MTYIGYAFGIPDSVMGITLLAAGTSVPDAMASLFVAKQGIASYEHLHIRRLHLPFCQQLHSVFPP